MKLKIELVSENCSLTMEQTYLRMHTADGFQFAARFTKIGSGVVRSITIKNGLNVTDATFRAMLSTLYDLLKVSDLERL